MSRCTTSSANLRPMSRLIANSPRDDHPCRPQQTPVQLVSGLHDLEHRIGLGRVRWLRHHRFVPRRVERLSQRIDYRNPELLQGAGEQLQGRLLAFPQAAGIRPAGVLYGQLQAVPHRQELGRELLEPIAVGGFDIALSALADVVELGRRAQVLLPVVLGTLVRFHQQLLQALDLIQLGSGLGKDAGRLRSGGGWDAPRGVIRTHQVRPPLDPERAADPPAAPRETPRVGVSGANSRRRRAV